MSQLGDFLERLYAPHERFTSVRATLRYWQDRLYANVASDAKYQHIRARVAERGQDSPAHEGRTPQERVSEAEIRVWLSGTDLGREEVRPLAGECWFPMLVIVSGGCWWYRRDAERVHQRNAHRESGCLSHADRHFSRPFIRMLFASLELEGAGSIRTAGHDCILVRARPTAESRLWSHWIPSGADVYDLAVDPERATILAITAHIGEAIFETNEVVEVVYDEPLGADLFTRPEEAPPPPRRKARPRRGT